MSLTPRQQQVFDLFRAAERADRQPPTLQDVAVRLGLSAPYVYTVIRAIEAKGMRFPRRRSRQVGNMPSDHAGHVGVKQGRLVGLPRGFRL